MKKKLRNKLGFTLVELLVVISIISILTIISVSSFTNAQIKGRDAQRKSDLDALSKALMMYFADKGVFPNSLEFGDTDTGLVDPNNLEMVYMRKIPLDPINGGEYIYEYKVDGTSKSFNLFANLENKEDSQCRQEKYRVGSKEYCYGVTSPNIIVKDWP